MRRVSKVRSLLSGRYSGLLKEIESEMKRASEDLDFEKAASLRDAVEAIRTIGSEQRMEDFDLKKRDYLAFLRNDYCCFFTLLSLRDGKVMGSESYHCEYYGSDDDAITEFLMDYYTEKGRELPDRLYVRSNDLALFQRLVEEQRKAKLKIMIPPSKGRDHILLLRAEENVRREFDSWVQKQGTLPALEVLQDTLALANLPQRIEGFDISHLNGKECVASLISFADGHPDRKNYRIFNIKTLKGKVDDYQAMREAISRRYTRLLNEDRPMPDLILVDGGVGQVNAAFEVLSSLDITVPVIGLAKKEEIIHLSEGKGTIDLPEGNPGLRILQHIRNETHRFAIDHNRKRREKTIKLDSLESVPGIGKKRGEKLLRTYGSLERIRAATPAELAKTARVGFEVAETLHEYLGRKIQDDLK